MEKPVVCVKCKHYTLKEQKRFFGGVVDSHVCESPMMVDVITGEEYWDYCPAVRSDKDLCGYEGKWFEENNK